VQTDSPDLYSLLGASPLRRAGLPFIFNCPQKAKIYLKLCRPG